MYLEGLTEARACAEAVMDTMRRYEIPPTPHYYALWYEYHAGHSPSLRRTIDVIISNHGSFDEKTLNDLYLTFFSSVKEELAVREASLRVQETLLDVIGLTGNGVVSASFEKSIGKLRQLTDHLVRETQRTTGRNEYVGGRLRESAEKIETLERHLENALREATMDGLTGVANRKSFEVTIRRLAGEAMNSGDDLALLMIDIDHFKRVNDTWGHQVGDVVLCHLTRILQECVRGHDHVARYGGEEFAVILPRTNADAAIVVGENIREALAREPLQVDISPPLDPVTISVGTSCYEPGEPLSEWVGRADAALYRAKREGRNLVQFA